MNTFSKIITEKFGPDITGAIGDQYRYMKTDLLEMAEKTNNGNDKSSLKKLLKSISSDGIDTAPVIVLTNDNEVWDMYMKHQNDIDALLSGSGYLSMSMSDTGSNSLYGFVTAGTRHAVSLLAAKMLEELFPG